MISVVVFAKALYSAFVLDHDTIVCFFAFQEIRLFPRNIVNPPAESTSKFPLSSVDDDLHILSPMFTQDLMCLKILFTVVQCTVVRACKNW
jgi:hypothetical protein